MKITHAWQGWALTSTAVLALAGAVVGIGMSGAAAGHAGLHAELAPLPGPKDVRFGRDIRPILSDRCFQCHGFDPGERQADLRLDRREDAVAARKDGAAIVPGDPDASELIRRISSADPSLRMPPADSHKRIISDHERDLLRRWIADGAVYEPHWAFIPPTRPDAPAVGDESWCRTPIDRFILARLEGEGLAPSAEADRVSLARRAFLDLTGLPPTPAEIDAFIADAAPDAFERLVGRLMTDEPYLSRHAERMAAPWMDQARYADTCGIHMDAGRQMWLWRDWVLNAYRTNMPFDRFVTEQLAGDLIPDATVEQKVASGFNRNHVTTDEGGAIAEEYLVEYAVDRTATTGSVFLGLTVGCARCHDHKFDPVTAEDFYSLLSFFNSIEEPGLYSQTPDFNRAYEPFLLVPTADQKERLDAIAAQTTELKARLEERTPEEESRRREFQGELWTRAGVSWAKADVTEAVSEGGAVLELQPDGSLRASGANPAKDTHTVTLRTEATGLRLISLECLPEPTAVEGRLGRADNGNAVVSGISAEAVSVADPTKREAIRLVWAWADTSQQNGDFDITNVLNAADDARVWALDAHNQKEARTAVLLADKPFGFEGGTEVRVAIRNHSMYNQHVLARFRLGLGAIGDEGAALLPTTNSRWYIVGPFPGDEQNRVWEPAYGPEEGESLDFAREFAGKQRWRFDANLADGLAIPLAAGRNIFYVGKLVYAPTARSIDLSLGSDDGFQIFVNGVKAAERNVERGLAPDQDKATISLRPGLNAVVMKIVNTGGPAGFYYQPTEKAELAGDLVAGLLPAEHRSPELEARLERAWRVAFFPRYRETEAKLTALDAEAAAINEKVPRTMVMKELMTPRQTYVLTRGQYDHPDKSRPVHRAVPKFLGSLPEGAPANRLGLAQWMTSDQNPLLARVTVNRLWEMVFGVGLVRTSEDFGIQGEWPSHPELLDWLAVEFRESGWDVRHMLRLMLTSTTYRQASVVRTDTSESDPDNRLLSYFPRRRLSAEQIRDQALYISGLLKEQVGGPSVKPYQPDGLWREVAMPQSNTREYKRGGMDDLWRRSLYTYWKRAAPPPSMVTLDAPTRESCTIRRTQTTTPLQALVLWNDEQFLEAARVLAERTLKEQPDDAARLTDLFRRCVARAPEEREMRVLRGALDAFRERYKSAPDDAKGLVSIGMAPRAEGLPADEVAAWTMIASSVMNLYETTTQE